MSDLSETSTFYVKAHSLVWDLIEAAQDEITIANDPGSTDDDLDCAVGKTFDMANYIIEYVRLGMCH